MTRVIFNTLIPFTIQKMSMKAVKRSMNNPVLNMRGCAGS